MIDSTLKSLLRKYDVPGPRYTSYPTAPTWTTDYGPSEHQHSLAAASQSTDPLSLYVHIPFCEQLCLYCGCSVLITQDSKKSLLYVDDLLAEARLQHRAIGTSRQVAQHHWGGGTPTFLPSDEIHRLYTGLREIFPTTTDAEVSIEVDPRVTSPEQLATLAKLGFNRISMGVQDFDPVVQEAIHRVQSFEQTRDLILEARRLGFRSVNIDLVYGLPHQSTEGFGRTLELVTTLSPDRLACYSYAHVPWLKKHQRVFDDSVLPSAEAKIELYLLAYEALLANGQVAIGMDHFAAAGDELTNAAQQGALHRNFMGYATKPAPDMLAMGMTAISEVSGAFAQNQKELRPWREAIQAGQLPIIRGLRRSADDERRRRIILDLMCRFRLRFDDYGGRDAFSEEFTYAKTGLDSMADDGLVTIDETEIIVTSLGRLFVRNASMLFDRYLSEQQASGQPVFSRTV